MSDKIYDRYDHLIGSLMQFKFLTDLLTPLKSFFKRSSKVSLDKIILNNINSYFFLINQVGLIQNQNGQNCSETFKGETYQKYFHDILPVNQEIKDLLINWYHLAFDSSRNFQDISQLAPQVITLDNNQTYKLNYQPVYNNQKISYIICSLTLNNNFEREKNIIEDNYSKMIKLLIKNQEGFKKFIEETPHHFDNLKIQFKRPTPNLKRILKDLHTLKGTSASYFFSSVSEHLLEIENEVAQVSNTSSATLDIEASLDKLNSTENLFKDFLKENDDIFSYALSMAKDGVLIPKNQIMEYAKLLEQKLTYDSELYQRYLNDFVLEDISNVFSKYRCVVESIAQAQDKKINFIVNSSDIRVYFPFYEELYQSLIHVIRNCIDHGIEKVSERERLGKLEPAQIKIDFKKIDLGHFQIIISDNGRGVKKSDLIQLASSMGLNLNDQELFQLVFKHGVTTKKTESDLSGKGVGLSIIKEKVEMLGGTAHFHSIENQGSILTITLPWVRSIKTSSASNQVAA